MRLGRQLGRQVDGLNRHHARPGEWLRTYWIPLVAVAGGALVVALVIVISLAARTVVH